MRKLLLSTSFLVLASTAMADTFALESAVQGVTIYPQGATVVRAITLPQMAAGDHILQIADIPEGFIPESLRIFGGDGLVITSTGFRDTRLPPDAREIAERKAIEDLIDAMQDKIQGKYDTKASAELQADAANARIAFLRAMSGQQAKGAADAMETGVISAQTLREMLGLVGDETLKALNEAHAARQEMRKIDEEIDDLQEDLRDLQLELDAAALPPADRVIVTLDVTASADVSGDLQVSYLIDDAAWMPVYELHLDTDTTELKMERKALMAQGTGEAWENVAVKLSTARPQMQLSPWELQAQQAYLYEPQQANEMLMLSQDAMRSDLGAVAAPMMMEEPARVAMATINMQGLTAEYHLPKPVSIDGDYAQGLFTIDQQVLSVELTARATPLLEESVYLFASLTNDSTSPYLPGKASFYRDGAFIGSNDSFEMIAAGQSADLAFGVLDGITTERTVLFRETGESGILTTSNDKIERYELRVENTTALAWDVVLYDRVPYSEEEDLEIVVSAKPTPSQRDVDGKRGVYAWEFSLAAGADKSISFSYTIGWPEGKELGFQ
ncbi:MAG: DUF4139 domain-containing protein [Paracoccaceae bacterium]